MIKANYPTEKFTALQTPFYYYDLELLRNTLESIKKINLPKNYEVHYALKANVNPEVLKTIREAGLGADCVSGGEVQAALDAGFSNSKIVFAGVGKADWEINLALDNDIYCFNVESVPELEVINELAEAKNKTAKIALRINPNVSAHTHKYITTGLNENKFGINMEDLESVIGLLPTLQNIQFIGIHFHIGSQITDMTSFHNLCVKIDEVQELFVKNNVEISDINVGGGLGVNYQHPNHFPIAEFEMYFSTYMDHLNLNPGQKLHFELGRAIVAQCGSLISKVLYIKKGKEKQFAILDAGMTDLIRPALYQAYHRIENLSSDGATEIYDVVGPICESSDVFAENAELNSTKRGDLIALRTAGAYGEIMASRYNLRKIPAAYTSDQLNGR